MPRGSRTSIHKGYKTPGSRITRIRINQSPDRPLVVRSRNLIPKAELQKNPWWWVNRRRGILRPRVGEDPLEMRAISKSLVKGTLPERIVYKYLLQMNMIEGLDFSFQSCVSSDHKVLTADLRWVRAGDLLPGDELLSFDEDGHPRRSWKRGVVLQNYLDVVECLEVVLSNGDRIITTPEHPWLVHYAPGKGDWGQNTGYSWVETQNLRIGAYVPRFMKTWEQDTSWESGWIAGFFDGEGSVIHGKTQVGGHAMTLTISQNKGSMFDRLVDYTTKLGYDFSIYDYTNSHQRSYDEGVRQVVHCRIAGGRNEALRFLGSIRPAKLDRLNIEKLGRLSKMENVRVVEVRSVGHREIARLGVDTHTYIAEGYAMHNSLQGGRLVLGGIVADFLFEPLRMIIQVQGPTHTQHLRSKKDDEQRMILSGMGYAVEDLEMDLIYNEPRFEDRMRTLFNIPGGYARGQIFGPHQIIDNTEEDAVMADELYTLANRLATAVEWLSNATGGEWQL